MLLPAVSVPTEPATPGVGLAGQPPPRPPVPDDVRDVRSDPALPFVQVRLDDSSWPWAGLGPPFAPPSARRSFQLHHSLALQLDGALYALFRERLERDVYASSELQGLCPLWGQPDLPWSTVIGLFCVDVRFLDQTLDTAQAHRAAGVWVVPARPGEASPAIDRLRGEASVTFELKDGDAKYTGGFVSFAAAHRVRRRPNRPERE
jgi:hypothetical protein